MNPYSPMDVVGHRKIFYLISGALALASVLAFALWGLRLGIDFTGGSIAEVEFKDARPSVSKLQSRSQNLGFGEIRFQPSGEKSLLIRTRDLSEEEHQALLETIAGSKAAGEEPILIERRFDSIGPTIGRELQKKSLLAVILVIILIVSYIAFAFRKVSQPVESWKYGVTTIIALVHDIAIPTGFFALAGYLWGFEVDTLFVTAILTILGFSVHDTIVVFDRVRENLKKSEPRRDFGDLVNSSVNETMVRSLNTSLTVILALAAVYFFGGEATRPFSLTLIIGIVGGTYSSIFIASPLLVTWHKLGQKNRIYG